MNRRKFALSWGRKLFFGISWPLSSALAILYLRSFILPESTAEWFYFVTTFFGHLGLLNALIYFILFCPVVLVFPTYYISRIWSLLLIAVLNLFIFIDALSFSSYHLHVYSYILNLVRLEGLHHLLGSNAGLMILVAGGFVLSVLVWIRGEMIWRSMQGRFSNPVKNWYLVFIAICLVISRLIYQYADIHPKLVEVFPLNINFKRAEKEYHDNRRFYYAGTDLQCQGKQNPNLVMIILREWSLRELDQTVMPKTYHMIKHAMIFNDHRAVAVNPESGMFSLMYSLPATYKTAADDQQSLLMTELQKRKYEIAQLSTTSQFYQWIEARTGEEINSHFLLITLDQKAADADKDIQDIILRLQQENLLRNSYVLMTGASASGLSQNIPLFWISPDRKSGEINHVTTAYDVVPTLLSSAWNCKKAFRASASAVPLELADRDWYIMTLQDGYQIVDLKQKSYISVRDGVIENAGGARSELVFPALRLMTKFNRPN